MTDETMTDTAIPPRRIRLSRRPARKYATLSAAAVVLVGAVGGGLHWWSVGRFMIDTDNAYVRADVVTVAPLVSGRLVAVVVADNQRVAAGQVLARIDDRDYRARLQDAEAAVAAAQADIAAQQARIANLDAQTNQQRSVIARGAAAIDGSAADARKADLEYRRQRMLVRQDIASAQTMEGAEAAAGRSRADLAAARASLSAEQERLPVLATERQAARSDLDKAQATLRRAQAALTLAKLQLERTVICAATAGIVGQRSLRVGQYVEPGTPLLAIVPDAVFIVANYKETQVDGVRPGQPVRIAVDAFGGGRLDGRVDSFAPASGAQFALLPPDNATGNFTKIVQRMPVRIRFDPGQPRLRDLRPGMSVEVTIDTRDIAR